MLQLLKNNRAPGVIFVGILVLLAWLPSFFHIPAVVHYETWGLYNVFFSWIKEAPFGGLLVSIAIYAFTMVLLVRLNVVHFLLEERSYMPAAFFVMISATFPPLLQMNPFILSNLFLVGALLALIRGEEHRAEPMALFKATLLLALGSLFYLKILFFVPFLWITAAMIRPLRWRGIANPLIVLIMTGIFLITWYWVFLDDLPQLFTLLEHNLSFSLREFPGVGLPELISLAYLLLLVIISSGYLLSRFQFRKIIIRKLYQVLFILFIYCLLFYVFVSGFRTEMLTMAAIPVSFLLANYFHRRRNHWIHKLMIWVWLLLIAYVHLAP